MIKSRLSVIATCKKCAGTGRTQEEPKNQYEREKGENCKYCEGERTTDRLYTACWVLSKNVLYNGKPFEFKNGETTQNNIGESGVVELTEPNKTALVRGPGEHEYNKRHVVAALPDYGVHILRDSGYHGSTIAAIPNRLICVCTTNSTNSLPGGSWNKYWGRVNQDMDQDFEEGWCNDWDRRRRLAHGLTPPFLKLTDEIESAASS